jgi:CBS domain containing-hemolysin-like protein
VFEITLIVGLIVANGIFSMAETAVVSARPPRLQQRAETSDLGARRALELAEHPNAFLAGFVVTQLGHIPAMGEWLIWNGWRFEVVDMDGNRVDTVLAMPVTGGPVSQADA